MISNDIHDWTLTLKTPTPYFNYKYVEVDTISWTPNRWEDGLNRIADLKLLANESKKSDGLYINDEWEHF